jgi:hypothetical protein
MAHIIGGGAVLVDVVPYVQDEVHIVAEGDIFVSGVKAILVVGAGDEGKTESDWDWSVACACVR